MSADFYRETPERTIEESLVVAHDDGQRVVVKNAAGNVMLDCSRWLFDMTWKRGWFKP